MTLFLTFLVKTMRIVQSVRKEDTVYVRIGPEVR